MSRAIDLPVTPRDQSWPQPTGKRKRRGPGRHLSRRQRVKAAAAARARRHA